MKTLPFAVDRLLQNSNFWLCAIAIGLTALHLSFTLKLTDNIDQLCLNILFWGAIYSLLWKKRNVLNLESDIYSSFLAFLLITLILLKSLSLFWFETSFLNIFPLISTFSVALLASGFKNLKQYWREFILVFILAVPDGIIGIIIANTINLSLLAAKFSTFFLWYLGFNVYRQGIYVILPTGTIEINTACSGFNAIMLLLRLSLLFIMMFPTELYKKVLASIGGIFIAFIINGMRIALMAVLVAYSNQQSFDYWHGENGSQIVSTISILIFGIFCRLLIRENESTEQNSVTSFE